MCHCGRRICLHGLSCKFSAGRHPKHSALNDSLNEVYRVREFLLFWNRRALIDCKRPDGITRFPFSNGEVYAEMPPAQTNMPVPTFIALRVLSYQQSTQRGRQRSKSAGSIGRLRLSSD